MRLEKMLLVGAAAFAMILGTVGCASDEDDLDMFRIKEGDKASASGIGQNGTDKDKNGNTGDADLDSTGGKGNTGVGEWGNSTGLSPYDDFGTPITGLSFQPVYFRFDQSSIDSAETSKLDQVAAYIMSNPGTGVVIEGNCDDKGSDEYNRALSERRALSVRSYLSSLGVGDERMQTVSFGEDKPAVPNAKSEAEHSKNRRAEFQFGKLK